MASIPSITDLSQAFQYLESFTNLEKSKLTNVQRNYRLDRMNVLLERFDEPHRNPRILHIAGTKGKGSTAVMLASILEAGGYKTGLYTSPHVESYLERINISLAPPDSSLIVALVNRIKDEIEHLQRTLPGDFPPTTFELMTLLAFLLFRETQCDIWVLETGIGGRLDATNVVSPLASLITPLDLEHTELLGNTLEEIAREKGGIIKPGVPVFCGIQEPRAKAVFRSLCDERGSALRFLEDEMEELRVRLEREGTAFTIKLKNRRAEEFHLALRGVFQAENAALAYLSLTYLSLAKTLPALPIDAYRKGFGRAFLPGRMEVRSWEPPVILDGAHTPLSVKRLMESFRILFPEKGVLIFGSISGKDPLHMARLLVPHFKHIVISTPGSFKESEPRKVYEIFRALHPGTVLVEAPDAALETALSLSGLNTPILVTGSFYMIAEIRRLLVPVPG